MRQLSNGGGSKLVTTAQRLDAQARANGTSLAQIAAQHCAPCAQMSDSPLLRNVGFQPAVPCSSSVERMLCYLDKGSCSFNKFGVPSAVKLRTNTLTLPDAVNGFQIGPGAGASSLGVFFPRTWVGEMVFHGINRIKVSFAIANVVGALTRADIESALFDDMDVRILQTGSVDPFHVVLQLESQDAQRSTLIPAAGGYYFPQHGQFVPFFIAPELFTFDFQGLAPGGAGDSYSLGACVRVYWEKIC